MHYSFDVLIMGGGLSGLCLAIQLRKRMAKLRISVVEKNKHPVPEAAHKVGESSVEIGSHYFQNILGLQHLLDEQLPKLGLRFFYPIHGNHDIAERPELGTSDFPPVPSFQIDRGRFENSLAKECQELGIDFLDGTKITEITLGKNAHQIQMEHLKEHHTAEVKWVIDASGRNNILKKKLKLSRPAYHDVNAIWFRIGQTIRIDDWSFNPSWQSRVKVSRHLSTNHLFGYGYWVWLIPLASGSTSIGIVADAKIHPFAEYNTFERALTWLGRLEPQCASIIEKERDHLQDFKSLKHYAHGCKQMYSGDGWGITGDSGMFVDPFYSPGSDFIAIGNSFLCDMITKQISGQPIKEEVKHYERMFRNIYLAFLTIYEDQYPLMGNAKIMSIKIIWDYCNYWGSIALLFFNNKLCDLPFMQKGSTYLEQVYRLNMDMQRFFREWNATEQETPNLPNTFIDYTKISFLRSLNQTLTKDFNDEELCQQLSSNISLLEELANEVIGFAVSTAPELSKKSPVIGTGTSEHLSEVFAVFNNKKTSTPPKAFGF